MPPGRARAPSVRRGPRRHRDPPGGRTQRARRVVHQGLLRRPGDRRAPALPRQAQPPSPRAAARRDAAVTGDELAFEGRAVGRLGSVAVSPRFGPIALALVRREAPVGSVVAVGDGGARARSSSCRSASRRFDRRSFYGYIPYKARRSIRSVTTNPARSAAPGAGSSTSCGVSGCDARYAATIRISSTSSGGRCVPTPGPRPDPPRANAAAVRRSRSSASPTPPVDQTPPDHPEGIK